MHLLGAKSPKMVHPVNCSCVTHYIGALYGGGGAMSLVLILEISLSILK